MSYKREMILNTFQELIFSKYGQNMESMNQIKAHASERNIFRLVSNGKSFVGVFNENKSENLAFISFSRVFLELGFMVPEIINVSDDGLFYIEEDLGDITLYDHSLVSDSSTNLSYFENALSDLIKFQVIAKDKIDYRDCYQTEKFDENVLRDDIKKFDEYYLTKYSHNIELLSEVESLTEKSIEILNNVKGNYFLYRDFQPRNIMIKGDKLFYIDYQSGRKGPLQYDVASFLYSGSINLNEDERLFLLSHYENELSKYLNYDKKEFRYYFYYFVFVRLLQVLGSYAYIYEKRKDEKMAEKISMALIKLKGIAKHIDNESLERFILKLTN